MMLGVESRAKRDTAHTVVIFLVSDPDVTFMSLDVSHMVCH